MKVALVHEFLTQLGGAERVLEVFHKMFPQAPVYTLFYDREKTRGQFDSWDIRISSLQRVPGAPRNYKWLLPLMPKAMESQNFDEYDLVLSDSSAFAKGVKTRKPTVHVCYCHTPTRYLWEDMDSYIENTNRPKAVKLAARFYLRNFLSKWDLRAAQRPDYLIANSWTVHDRIQKYYHRDSEVIYPPVDTEFFSPPRAMASGEGEREVEPAYYFTASRLEPYKKIDLVVEAFNKLGLPLKVAGDGTEAKNLKRRAKTNIEFLGRVTDEQLRALYRGAKAFIFPALEDAGIMALESLACGAPVIGFRKGGTAEYIETGKNGVLFGEQSADAIGRAVQSFEKKKFDPATLRKFAGQFDTKIFINKLKEFLLDKVGLTEVGF